MARDIVHEVELAHPVAAVWAALTEPAALSEWLMATTDFTAEVGAAFTLKAKPVPGWDGVITGTVLEVEPPRRLAYTWRGSHMRRPTTVTWTLTPLDGDSTRLRLEHAGFAGPSGLLLRAMHQGGWKKFLRRTLPAYLGTGASRAR